jgi:hypothetical protein
MTASSRFVPVVDDHWRIALLLSRGLERGGRVRAVANRLQTLKARFATAVRLRAVGRADA